MKLGELIHLEKKLSNKQSTIQHDKEIDDLKIQNARLQEQLKNIPSSILFTPYIFDEMDHLGGGRPSFFSVRKPNA